MESFISYHRILSFASLVEKSLIAFFQIYSRPVYWAPVLLGTGIGLYFSFNREPSLWLCCTTICILAGAFLLLRHHFLGRYFFAGLFLVSLGISVSSIRTTLKKTPLLTEEISPHWIEGTISKIEDLPTHQRLTLENVFLKYPEKRTLPAVRISLRGRLKVNESILPGDRLRLKAALMPPSGPIAPGTYDFRRRAYFEGLSGVGYGLSPVRKISTPPSSFFIIIKKRLDLWRHKITQKLRFSLGTPTGEIAAALITGDRSGITTDIRDNFANAGTAHLLAISGLHLSVIAGLFFLIIRTVLALIPALSLRFPIKKWAAGMALIGTAGYLLLCGAPLSAQRAFFMSSLVLVAIMIDRTALTLRNVCLAAFIILLFLPESLILPSFQLSFAAVLALVAVYETLRQREKIHHKDRGPLKRFSLYFLSVAGTTFIATAATTPYIVQTFHKLTLHSIPANLMAVPWTSFVLIPMLILYLGLMPFNGGSLLETPLNFVIQTLLEISQSVAKWPGAVVLSPPTSRTALLMLTFGGLWLCLVRKNLRLLGLIPASIALVIWFFMSPVPDLFISGDLRVIAMRSENGNVYLPSRRSGRFARESFQSLSASSHSITLPSPKKYMPADIQYLEEGSYLFKGSLKVTVTNDVSLQLENKEGAILLDEKVARDNKGTLIWIQGNKLKVKSLKDTLGSRPWSPPE